MLDRKEIEEHLHGVDAHFCSAFVARSALRALPLLVHDNKKKAFWYWSQSECVEHLLSIFMAQQANISFAILKKEISINDCFFSAYDAATEVYDANDRIAASAIYAGAINDMVTEIHDYEYYDEVYENFTPNMYSYSIAITDACDAAYLYDTTHSSKVMQGILSDLDNIHKKSLISFFYSPLWEDSPPKQWHLHWQRFEKELIELGANFEVWLEWYKDRVEGKPLDKKLEEKCLTIPEEIKVKGVKAINGYLLTLRKKVNQKPLNLVRAIFIGYGSAGKTSLIRVLKGEDIIENKEEMTPGIEIRQWPVGDTDIKARFWDFGGQVMSHSTHQFFLRERCLYILVLDARTEINSNEQAEYWLEHIKAFGKNSPVMLVCNKADLMVVNLDMNALKEKYPNIVGFYHISCTQYNQDRFKTRFDIFRDDLIEQLQTVGTHQVYFTENQFKVLEKIRKESSQKTLLPHSDFDTLCKKHGVGDVGLSQKDFLGLLDALGEVVYFPEIKYLNAYVLNPRWLTYGVYTLLYADKTTQQQGVLSEDDVVEILQSKTVSDERKNILDYPSDKCCFIVDAMEQFKLCYRLPYDRKYFVIPDKLPAKQPDLKSCFDMKTENTITFEFDFQGFLPRHVMPTFIVSRHENIICSSKTKKQLVWQNGVILENTEHHARARVQVDYHERVLKLWVQGIGARTFLAILHDEIKKILKRMEKLKYDELVVLPESTRIKKGNFLNHKLGSVEKVHYPRLLAEARGRKPTFISNAGNEYDLQKILGFIMTEEKKKQEGVSYITNNYVQGSAGAVGGSGDKQKISGQVILQAGQQQAINELQQAVSKLMQDVANYQNIDFTVKSEAYEELKQIHEHLQNLEQATPENKSKLTQLLDGVKNGTSGAIQLAKNIQGSEETITWLLEKATTVGLLLGS